MPHRIIRCLTLLLASLIFLSACTSCTTTPCDESKPTEQTWQDPIYPGAANISKAPVYGYATTFTTTDSREQVLTFYHNALVNAGWATEKTSTPVPNQTSATYSGYANCGAFSSIEIQAIRIDDVTNVSVTTMWWRCE